MNYKSKIGRRKAIGGLGAGLATLTMSPVFGSPLKTNTTQAYQEQGLEDPVNKYPSHLLKVSHNHGRDW